MLTQGGLKNKADIFIYTLGMKMLVFLFKFTEFHFLNSNWSQINICVCNVLAPNRWQAIAWTNDEPSSAVHYVITRPPWTKYALYENIKYFFLKFTSGISFIGIL